MPDNRGTTSPGLAKVTKRLIGLVLLTLACVVAISGVANTGSYLALAVLLATAGLRATRVTSGTWASRDSRIPAVPGMQPRMHA